MNPDVFLKQEDIALLVQALNTLALDVDSAESRKDLLLNAGVHQSLRSKLIYETSAQLFSHQLVAYFRNYRVSGHQPVYHPMVSLLEYLLQTRELEDEDKNIFTRLVRQGQSNFGALEARSAVGRIEARPGEATGTGVLVSKQHLLTCHHVLQHIFEKGYKSAWVRFGYKTGRYGVESGELFPLDIQNIVNDGSKCDGAFDYALVRVIGNPELPVARLSLNILRSQQEIRLIHHPHGEPVQISPIGQAVQIDQEFIKHNLEVNHGSSGAPIFDLDWQVVALHRGAMALSRPSAPGITEAVPLASIWNTIQSSLNASHDKAPGI